MFPLLIPMAIGAFGGAALNKKNPLKGALLGAGLGAGGGLLAAPAAGAAAAGAAGGAGVAGAVSGTAGTAGAAGGLSVAPGIGTALTSPGVAGGLKLGASALPAGITGSTGVAGGLTPTLGSGTTLFGSGAAAPTLMSTLKGAATQAKPFLEAAGAAQGAMSMFGGEQAQPAPVPQPAVQTSSLPELYQSLLQAQQATFAEDVERRKRRQSLLGGME